MFPLKKIGKLKKQDVRRFTDYKEIIYTLF